MTIDNNSKEPQSASTKPIKVIMIALVVIATAVAIWQFNEYTMQQRQADNRLYLQAQKQINRFELERAFARHSTRYKIHDDGTVTDKKTGLMWKRCSEGQIWTGTTCSGEVSKYTWKMAKKHAGGVVHAGHSDWRVPSIKELNTLVYCSNGYQIKYSEDGYDSTDGCKGGSGSYQRPTINQAAFPNTPDDFFWSASPYATDSTYAWLLYFGHGEDGSPNSDYSFGLRLLRSGH